MVICQTACWQYAVKLYPSVFLTPIMPPIHPSEVLNVLIIAISLGRVDLAYSYYLLCTSAPMSPSNKQGSVSLLAAIVSARAREISV